MMAPSLPLLSCESSVPVKKILIEKKIAQPLIFKKMHFLCLTSQSWFVFKKLVLDTYEFLT